MNCHESALEIFLFVSIIEFHQLQTRAGSQTYGVPVDLGKPGLGLHCSIPPPLLCLGGGPHHNSLL